MQKRSTNNGRERLKLVTYKEGIPFAPILNQHFVTLTHGWALVMMNVLVLQRQLLEKARLQRPRKNPKLKDNQRNINSLYPRRYYSNVEETRLITSPGGAKDN